MLKLIEEFATTGPRLPKPLHTVEDHRYRDRLAISAARSVTCALELLRLRGAPTILRCISPLFGRLLTKVIIDGVPLTFPAYDHYWCRYLYARAPYEPDVEAIFRNYGSGRLLIDCGANIGYWSARHRSFGFTDAIAIEANPKLVAILRRNHHKVIHAAVHSRSGETLLLEGDGAIGAIGERGVPVPSLALADLEIEGPVLVKLDVEGAEIPAIEGARGLDAIFVYEDWPSRKMEVTRHLLASGYDVRGFDETRIRSVDDAMAFNARTRTAYGPSNFVATKIER